MEPLLQGNNGNGPHRDPNSTYCPDSGAIRAWRAPPLRGIGPGGEFIFVPWRASVDFYESANEHQCELQLRGIVDHFLTIRHHGPISQLGRDGGFSSNDST